MLHVFRKWSKNHGLSRSIIFLYLVIGEEPIHPGSWQFPKLQEVKMNRWSNLLCNIQPDKWWVPATHSNPQLHRKCFPETLWLIRTDGVQHQMPQPQPSAGAWVVMGPARLGFLHMQGKSHQGRHGYMHESSHSSKILLMWLSIDWKFHSVVLGSIEQLAFDERCAPRIHFHRRVENIQMTKLVAVI